MKSLPLKATLTYLVLGSTWVIGSDLVLESLPLSPGAMAAANAAKGLLFVAASAGLIYHGVKRHCARVEQDAQAAKDRVYRHTVAASQHILLNFVNQSQLMRLTAEGCEDFDREVLEMDEQARLAAQLALFGLRDVRQVDEAAISEVVEKTTGVPFPVERGMPLRELSVAA